MKLSGAWRRDYAEFYDTQEALLIDAMDNADSIYTVFARLQSLAVKCGCAGMLLFHGSVPYTDEMLAAVTKKTVPAFRQCMQPLVQLGLVTDTDGIYAIADWELNQNAPAIDAMRDGNRERKAAQRKRENPSGKTAFDKKREKFLAYLADHPGASTSEIRRETGLGRATIVKYRKELTLPPGDEGVQKSVQNSVQDCSISGVQSDTQGVQLNTNLNANLNTSPHDEAAGDGSIHAINEGVQTPSRPKNIDDRYKKPSTSTSDGEAGFRIPTREEVRSYFLAKGFATSADRFYDVNARRGWVTKTGKIVDDWKKLAEVWDKHELAQHAPADRDGAGRALPTIEEVMAKYKCDPETARALLAEDLY